MVGFESPKCFVAEPTVVDPRASFSTIPRRTGWASAANESLVITLTMLGGHPPVNARSGRWIHRRKTTPYRKASDGFGPNRLASLIAEAAPALLALPQYLPRRER